VAFDWEEYLRIANFLRNPPPSSFSLEAAQRSAVSRAYYAAFCCLRNYAEKHLGFRRKKGPSDHQKLGEYLKKRGEDWRSIVDCLRELRVWRNDCDYDDEVGDLNTMVSNAISTAEHIIRSLGHSRNSVCG
jgi:uncharacterized protein (UPF0332 family)